MTKFVLSLISIYFLALGSLFSELEKFAGGFFSSGKKQFNSKNGIIERY